ncbi:MAG TPA: rod shape-determining protein MreC [Longimicrobiaceae bacterium]|nr:rod shape-determining protein MreC [Longimicrobiaceae bacterium]
MAALFFALALILLFLPGAYREALAGGVRATLLRPVLALQRGAIERDARLADPARLRAERDSLAAFLVGQAALAAENQQLRDILGLGRRLPPTFVSAEVVRLPGRSLEGSFQVTAGQRDGIRPGAPIVAAAGLVGRVREVDGTTATGIDWMNPDFRASAMTLDGEAYGIAEPRRGPGGEPMLALTGTPRHIRLAEGTLIVTSGHGGVFPRGIPIGTIAGTEGGGESWQKSYLIRPLVSPAEMNYVLVLGPPEPTGTMQDLAAAWGIRAEAPAPDSATFEQGGQLTGAPSATTSEPTTENPEPEPSTGPQLLGEPVRPPPADTTGPGAAG